MPWLAAPPRTSGAIRCSGRPHAQPYQFPLYHDHLGRSNQAMQFLKQNYPPIDAAFLGEYVAMHAR